MNLPNKLTLLRVLMIPVFCVFLHFSPDSTLWRWLSLCVFALACLTDWLDGQIARRRNLVTNFGKFMDPIADKILVMSAFVMASTIAKYKTASQMFAVLLTIVLVPGPYEIIARIMLYISVFLTALSGADYIWKNRKFLRG